MPRGFVLYFTADERVLYRATRSGLERVAVYGADDDGVERLRALLRGASGALVALLADLAGEDFREDQIPLLRGAERAAVLERRLAQRFRDTRLAAALPLGPAAGERRGERLLLASFVNTAPFAPWLDAIGQSGARLAGVYSAPLLAPALAARLGAGARSVILVTVNAAGLRQSFVEAGRLRFARLERAGDLAGEVLAAFVRSETVRLAQYLRTLRALARDGPPLEAIVVAPEGERAAFERALVSDHQLLFRTVDFAEAAARAGLRRRVPAAGAEQLYLHLALRRPPKEQFARLEDRRDYVLWQMRRALIGAGVAALGACALYAGAIWLDILGVRDLAAAQRREAQQATRQHERITATFPAAHTSTENLKATVVEFRAIAARAASPEPAFAHLARTLGEFPQIELEALVWNTEAPRERGAPKPGAMPAEERAAAKPAATDPDRAQYLEISGRVEAASRTDYRAITLLVQRFAQTLAAAEGWRVLSLRLPFDLTPEGTLSGDIGERADRGEPPRFVVVLAKATP